MAALDGDRVSTDDHPTKTPAANDTSTSSPHLSFELSTSNERGDLDWSTWIDVVALLRQHKFVPRVESVDDSRVVLNL